MDTDIMTEAGNKSQEKNEGQFILVPMWLLGAKIPEGAKLLAGHILSLSKQTGFAYKSNGKYAETFDVTAWTIRGWIKALEEAGLVRVEGRETGRRIFPLFTHNGQITKGLGKSNPPLENPNPPVGKIKGAGLENPNGGGVKSPTQIDKEIDKEKREGNRNVSLSAVGGERKKSESEQVEPSAKTTKKQEVQPFTVPTLEQTVDYATSLPLVKQLNLSINSVRDRCELFLAHYEARGWLYPGRVPVAKWEPAVDTWFSKAAEDGLLCRSSSAPTMGTPSVDPEAHLKGLIKNIPHPYADDEDLD